MIHFSVHFSLSHTTTLCSHTMNHVSVQFSLFILILCPRGTISSQLSSLLNISIIHSDTPCSHIAWYNYQFRLYCSFWYTVLLAHTVPTFSSIFTFILIHYALVAWYTFLTFFNDLFWYAVLT
jgi:hypothetical protein